jgi:hypothetical protein
MPLEVEIPVKEVQRYMGYHGIVEIEPDMKDKIDKAIDHVSTQSHPRIISKEYPVKIDGNDITICAESEELILHSEGLARNLEGCIGAVLLAATIGPACDMLVRRASIRSAAEASIYQPVNIGARDCSYVCCLGSFYAYNDINKIRRSDKISVNNNELGASIEAINQKPSRQGDGGFTKKLKSVILTEEE